MELKTETSVERNARVFPAGSRVKVMRDYREEIEDGGELFATVTGIDRFGRIEVEYQDHDEIVGDRVIKKYYDITQLLLAK